MSARRQSKKTIEVSVSPAGAISIEAEGYTGSGCEEATRFLEEALGLPGKRIRFAQRHQQERQCKAMLHGLEVAQRLLHQPQTFFGPAEQGKSMAQDA